MSKALIRRGWRPTEPVMGREQALDRMLAECQKLGANAVVNVRFATSMVMQGSAELLVYGTAVVIEDI